MDRLFAVIALLLLPLLGQAATISGQVSAPGEALASAARVTLFTDDLRFFQERRTDTEDRFAFRFVPEGEYRLGVAARGYEYVERAISVEGARLEEDFTLAPETHGGRWSIVGSTYPELLHGSGSGTLLPSGEVMFCHDSRDPILFDPPSGLTWQGAGSGRGLGCHAVTVNTDGTLFMAGGSPDGRPVTAVPWAQNFSRVFNQWIFAPDMNVPRWYPGMVRLTDNRLLVLGGELGGGNGRTNTTEIFDPATSQWEMSGSFRRPIDYPPAVLLYTGEAFKTWTEPELYDPQTEQWRLAANAPQVRRGAAGGGHSDHGIVMLPDGRVMTVGISPVDGASDPRFSELYDPETNTWGLGPNPRHLRARPESLLLPDGRVLAFGGTYSGDDPDSIERANAGIVSGATRVSDLYDPATDVWRAVADMNRFIHYHSVTVLAADGRVINTGGAGLTSERSFAGDDDSIEAFEPPYLFRGVRPEIRDLSTNEMSPGDGFLLEIAYTDSATEVILIGTRAQTHWIDSGPQRFLSVDFTQDEGLISAQVPADPNRAVPGYYLLFVLVDDIPSEGRVVRIAPAEDAPGTLPEVSVEAVEENGLRFRIARSGNLGAPLPVHYRVSGAALAGTDYEPLPAFAVIPEGEEAVNLPVEPAAGVADEAPRTVTLTLTPQGGYRVEAGSESAFFVLGDAAASDPAPRLRFAMDGGAGMLLLDSTPRRRIRLEISDDLLIWKRAADFFSGDGALSIRESLDEENRLFFRLQSFPLMDDF